MRDPGTFEDPDEFRPERFILDGKLNATILDPSRFVFGNGRRWRILIRAVIVTLTGLSLSRRICPGRHFAEVSLLLNAASVLHTFDIGPPLDGHGNPIVIEPQLSDGFMSYVLRSVAGRMGTNSALIRCTGILKIVDAPSRLALSKPKL